MRRLIAAATLLALAAPLTARAAEVPAAPKGTAGHTASAPAVPAAPMVPEPRLTNIRQLTHGGENAEAYFSFDNSRLIFQSTRPPFDCDQIFSMKLDGSDVRQMNDGKGRTTCSYYYPDGRSYLFASTHLGGDACPPRPSFSKGYVWAVYADYDIFQADLTGKILKRLTSAPGYDAEATIAPDGSRIVFTSDRDGDLEIYTMKLDGSDVQRLTNAPGYDGGPFFSPDSKTIVYRAFHPTDVKELADGKALLNDHLVRPSTLDIMVMNADGSNPRVVVSNKAANFGPFMHPDGRRIIFASNTADPRGRNFDLFIVNVDGTGLERVTFNDTFDGFPMFSADGRQLVFASNRGGTQVGETNIFIADWVDTPPGK